MPLSELLPVHNMLGSVSGKSKSAGCVTGRAGGSCTESELEEDRRVADLCASEIAIGSSAICPKYIGWWTFFRPVVFDFQSVWLNLCDSTSKIFPWRSQQRSCLSMEKFGAPRQVSWALTRPAQWILWSSRKSRRLRIVPSDNVGG